MHTVVETPSYLASAKEEKMTEAEMKAAVDLIAANPEAGDVIVGAGGCRKVRIAGKGKGKSGGYRVVTYFYDDQCRFIYSLCWRKDRGRISRRRSALRWEKWRSTLLKPRSV